VIVIIMEACTDFSEHLCCVEVTMTEKLYRAIFERPVIWYPLHETDLKKSNLRTVDLNFSCA